MKKLLAFILLVNLGLQAQNDTAFVKRIPADSSRLKLNMDAVYSRPFLQAGKIPVALGGYVEANSNYEVTEGISDGLSFQIPRMTLFISSTIKKRLKFLSELELEDGGRQLSIEFASMDVELHPLLNLRGGVIMNPIGAFNQNHDGPKWEFVNRPVSATELIPSTWSNVGFGLFGKLARRRFVWAYELYASNGFDNRIVSNQRGRTWLAATKQNPDRFNQSFNGVPLFTAKTAFRHRNIGELGLSWMGGVYNEFERDGLFLDQKRRVDVFAVDFNTTLPVWNTYITGEYVWILVDVPDTYSQQFGSRQEGGFVDVVQPLFKRNILGWNNSVINAAFRFEYVDFNVGRFHETNEIIGDHLLAISPGLSFRPSAQTVLRVNYRYSWHTDLLGNPPVRSAGLQVGFSTYF